MLHLSDDEEDESSPAAARGGEREREFSEVAKHWRFHDTLSTMTLTRLDVAPTVGLDSYHLRFKKLHREDSEETIPVTQAQYQAFFRCFEASITKLDYFIECTLDWKRWLLSYCVAIFGQSLQSTYLNVFFGYYAKNHHLFVSKIMPIMSGVDHFVFLTSLFGILHQADTTTKLLMYIIDGVIHQCPWNRCPSDKVHYNLGHNITVECVDLREFRAKNKTGVRFIQGNIVKSPDEVEYYRYATFDYLERMIPTSTNPIINEFMPFHFLTFVAVLMVSFGASRSLYNKDFWQILKRVHKFHFCALLPVCAHFLVAYLWNPKHNLRQPLRGRVYENQMVFYRSIIVFMGTDSISTPPILHILIAKSARKLSSEPEPNSVSVQTIISTTTYMFFRHFVDVLLLEHSMKLLGADVGTFVGCQESRISLVHWPIYFATFIFGNLLTILYFCTIATIEIMTLIVICQTFVITIKSKYHNLNSTHIAVGIFGLAVIGAVSTSYKGLNFFICSIVINLSMYFNKALITCLEIVTVCWFYPFGRFLDDIRFSLGIEVSKFRIWSFYISSVWCFVMIHLVFSDVGVLLDDCERNELPLYRAFIIASLSIIPAGCLIMCLRAIIGNVAWKQLFKPVPEWGPSDFSIRQLRKLYDSRHFVLSQAPRDLARYMIRRTQPLAHEVDIDYGE